jgi:hypothetical protein
LENLATLQRPELLRKFPAKIKENPENHENFLHSFVCVFMLLVRASHVIQGRPTKNYSVDCIQENRQFFFLTFRSMEKCRPFFWATLCQVLGWWEAGTMCEIHKGDKEKKGLILIDISAVGARFLISMEIYPLSESLAPALCQNL